MDPHRTPSPPPPSLHPILINRTQQVEPPSNPPIRPKPRLYSDDLHAQLVENPDTPFFAAMLFRMYWAVEDARARAEVQAEGPDGGVGRESGRETRGELEGERELAFDYALAAVALAVKVRASRF